ncbi:MAG TPA: TRAP transporter small permease [Geminicoccaceae bacterium]|nr:TRAP transporter small permease [Geminicoccaceae bacterium]
MRAFNRGVDLLSALLRVVILLMAAAIFVIIVATVITRYGFNYVVSWSEEVPRYLLIWISFLGAAVCVDLKDHIAFDYLYKRFPRRLRTAVQFLINAAIFAFGYIMLVYGIRFVQAFGGDFMESIPFTNVWYYTALPVSGALIMLYSLRDQLNAWFVGERRLEHDPGHSAA